MAFEAIRRLLAEPPEGLASGHGEASYVVSELLLDNGAGVYLESTAAQADQDARLLPEAAGRMISSIGQRSVVTRNVGGSSLLHADVHILCAAEQEDTTIPALLRWLSNDSRGTATVIPGLGVTAWWALREDVMWSTRKESLERIKKALSHDRPSGPLVPEI